MYLFNLLIKVAVNDVLPLKDPRRNSNVWVITLCLKKHPRRF